VPLTRQPIVVYRVDWGKGEKKLRIWGGNGTPGLLWQDAGVRAYARSSLRKGNRRKKEKGQGKDWGKGTPLDSMKSIKMKSLRGNG